MKLSWIRATAAAALLAFGSGRGAKADLQVYYEAPTVQSSQVTGATVTTETFNGFSVGSNYSTLNTGIGTITSSGTFAIVAANEYGGAGGTGNYFAVGAQSNSAAPATLTLAMGTPQAYFGFWWSAADANNQVSFYGPSNTFLGSFNTAYVLSLISGNSAYFGNPTSAFHGQDPNEPFVYLNFVGTNGTLISDVVFANSNTTASGFESDNWSIAATAPTGNLGTPVSGGIMTPEPSSLSIVLGMCTLGGLAYRLRRRPAAG